MKISYIHNNTLYFLQKQPYETDDDAFKRLWFILNNNLSFNSIKDINESKKYLNKINGMTYL
jgi:hypothetical protein